MALRTFTVDFAQHQFWILDSDVLQDGPRRWAGDYTDVDWETVGVADGVVSVFGPRDAGAAPVDVVVLDAAPSDELDAWRQVVEASLDVRGTALRLESENTHDVEMPIEPGVYRVRVSASALDTIDEDTGESGDDRYRIELWRAASAPSSVLKKFELDE